MVNCEDANGISPALTRTYEGLAVKVVVVVVGGVDKLRALTLHHLYLRWISQTRRGTGRWAFFFSAPVYQGADLEISVFNCTYSEDYWETCKCKKKKELTPVIQRNLVEFYKCSSYNDSIVL